MAKSWDPAKETSWPSCTNRLCMSLWQGNQETFGGTSHGPRSPCFRGLSASDSASLLTRSGPQLQVLLPRCPVGSPRRGTTTQLSTIIPVLGSLTSERPNRLGTIEGKILFERKMASLGHTVEHYHADNGVFAALKWEEACIEAGRGYSYSRVNAHFQSGVAERRTRELQEHERAMPIHAHTRWPKAIRPPMALCTSPCL
jgi:hypothetical protein